MNRRVKSSIALVLLLAVVFGLIPAIPVSAASDTSALGQLADSFTANSSTFTLSTSSRFYIVADAEPEDDLLQTVQLAQRQFAIDGRPSSTPLTIVWGAESGAAAGDIVIAADSSIAFEGYKLAVTTKAYIYYSDVNGLLYGLNTLLKHFRNADANAITGFTSTDAPDTVQRAVSLDCGRKYYTKDWICNFIRQMSWMGYNTLELHFSDDSGFRMDFWDPEFYTENYQPANDFSWVCGSNYTSWTLSAYQADVDKGKYLTTAEVVEILQTAKEYHIDVIPAFDSPSHLDYMTWTFEQNYNTYPNYSFYSTYNNKTYYAADVDGCINYTGKTDATTALQWPYYSAVNVNGEQAKAFIFELYIDIANFFKEYAGSTDFSIGADEVQLSTGNLASGYSYAWGYSDFVSYINELNTLLNNKGYTIRMFNDFIGSTAYDASSYDYADNIEILYWDSPFNPSSGGTGTTTEPASYFVDQGSIIYNCIQTNTYYALRKTSSGSDARSVDNRQWTFYHADEESIYNEWNGADVSEHGDYEESVDPIPEANLGGAYFLIWCDYACISTEAEIWDGCYDTSGSGEYYSLMNRMWSNIIKQWNWDINDTLSFSSYETIRDEFGHFPGFSSCSAKPSDYADSCTGYVSYCRVEITAQSAIMSLPCTNAVDATSLELGTINAGNSCTAVALYKNTEGELWYKVVTNSGLVGYVRATNTKFLRALTDDITVANYDVPSGHVKGNYFNVTGEISSKFNTLTTAAVYIYSGFGTSGTQVTGYSASVTDNYYSLQGSTIDYNTEFNIVPTGKNTYVISAGYKSYYANGDTVTTATGTVNLVEKCFYVLSSSVSQSSCSHSYSTTTLHAATCSTPGTKVYACSKCGYVYEETIALTDHSYTATVVSEATCTTDGVTVYSCSACGHAYEQVTSGGGHSYTGEVIPATCQDYAKTRYTCSNCGDTYDTYAMTEWQSTKPEGVDDSQIETKTVYRYSDKETTTSYETSLDGWTQISSSWVKSGTGSVQYVNSWPSGFSTSSSNYTKYNNAGNKVSAYTTDTAKRVINSDKVTGYLFYHWCYSNSYYSTSYKTGSYTTFHSFYSSSFSTTDYDSSDGSYKYANSSCCTNGDWYWYVDVYTQAYTDYKMQFTYARWGDWSDWSDTVYTESDTRNVETQTMYRYVDGSLGDHTWVDGVCSVCGTVCGHTYQNNVCTVCGQAKTIQDMYLFGYINGANYACEEDYANLGEYKFVDGQVVVTFASDSYVGVKAADNEHWYMTDGWQGFVSSATLYNTTSGISADKLYVPGGTEVTFTLVDNGDDTYTLSYVAVACGHEKHSTDGICSVCGATVEHSYDTTGFCSCGLECEHDMEDGYCTICGAECAHVYKDFVCTLCGAAKPEVDYYLFGYINGANYACEEDYENLGEYKFVDGSLVVTFSSDSYVAVRASDMENWYMTDGWQDFVSGVTLYNTKTLDGTADKVFVPGGTEVTFTLVDNGDDTLTLSYVAVECPHASHDQTGICLACGATVEHVYTSTGYCSCGLACVHEWGDDSVCDTCGYTCPHSYQNNVCTACGYEKPEQDMYLFGFINGGDYAWSGDYENLGIYKFVDGTLTAYFTTDSYVGVKSADNLNWYLTETYDETATSATLSNSDRTGAEEKVFVPGGKLVTFTLVDNGDDTYSLSYVAVDCPHESHGTDGICTVCGATVSHSYKNDGLCSICGKACAHSFKNGICSVCGMPCAHDWDDGICSTCGMICDHDWEDGACSICGMDCDHGWVDGVCTTCGLVCGHDWAEGRCSICGLVCKHTYQNNVCTNCGMNKPVVDYYLFGVINGADYGFGEDAANLGEYKFVDGQVVAAFREDSYVAVKADSNAGSYMTNGDPGNATSAVLYNTAVISEGGKLYVPGGMIVTFTLVDNGDDTLTLSYTAVACAHESHDSNGICAVCGQTVDHSHTAVVTAPTCTAQGYTTYTCGICGDTYVSDYVDATGHTEGEPVKENEVSATCTADGSYDSVVYCTVCGGEISRTTVTVGATGHSFGEWTETKAPTCTEAGEETRTCACGETETREVESLGHDYTAVVTAPTCTEQGYTTYTCGTCGDSYVDDYVDATGHSFGEWTETKAPTCTEAGEETRTCACGETETREVESLGHDYAAEVTAPTCTEQGYTTYTCTACGDNYVSDYVDATGHSFGEWTETKAPTCTEAGEETRTCACGETETREVESLGHDYKAVVTAPTCTEQGYTTYTCGICGDSYVDDYVDATGHSFGEWTETKAPTCTEAGEETRTCACGETETREVESLGHDYKAVVTAPTCTEQGYTTYTCGICGDTYVSDYVDATGHSFGEWTETKAPTCTEAGEETRTCACGETETREVESLGHDYKAVVTAPTCTEQGYTTYTCGTCGDSYVDDYVDATGHTEGETVKENEVNATCTADGSYDNVVYCTVCGEEISRTTVTVGATGHSFGEWTETKAPTCTEAGEETRTCACGETETREVESLGHDYKAVVTAPTCTEQGYTTYTCGTCGDSYVDDYVDATGHSFGEWTETKAPTCTEAGEETRTCACGETETREVESLGHDYTAVVTAPTCTEQGYTTYTCGTCGDSYVDDYVDATGHSFGEWTETKAPTCTEVGEETRTCACGETETREVESLGHDYAAVVTAPTCTEQGYTTYTCGTCGDSYVDDYVDATGHTEGETVKENEVAATCTTDGSYDNVVYCTVCGEELSRTTVTVGATGHSYENGSCSVCGEADPDASQRFTLAGSNMVLGGVLDMNFFVNQTDISGTDYYAEITHYAQSGTKVITVPYSEWGTYGTFYMLTLEGLEARQMADKIEVVIYSADGTQVSETWTDSIRDYSMRTYEARNEEGKTLLVDMLNYGAAAQTFFGYNASDLANNQLTEEQLAYATDSVSCTDQRVQGDNYVGSALVLESRIILTLLFKDVTTDMYAVVTYTDHYGVAQEITVQGSEFSQYYSYYGVMVDELVVADGDQLVTVTVYNADGTVFGSATDSMNSYAARNLNSDAIYEMVAKFTASAYAYFHE